MAVTIKNPVTIVKQGEVPTPTHPTTWAELKAMSATALQAIYPEGSVVDIACSVKNPANLSQSHNWEWIVESYGTCRIENDNTDYPCVTLLARRGTIDLYYFDHPERELADSAVETTAVDGVYYYGTTAASGNPTAANTTALNLSPGDAIPYSDYARIIKSSINTTNSNIVIIWNNGYNNYPLSNLRQWMNANDVGNAWFVPSHVGDTAPTYRNQPGLFYCLPDDFKAVLSRAAVETALNTVTDGGITETVYDYLFLPSRYETRNVSSPVEGSPFTGITTCTDRCKTLVDEATMPQNSSTKMWWLRSARRSDVYRGSAITVAGNATEDRALNYALNVVPACKIILAGA